MQNEKYEVIYEVVLKVSNLNLFGPDFLQKQDKKQLSVGSLTTCELVSHFHYDLTELLS